MALMEYEADYALERGALEDPPPEDVAPLVVDVLPAYATMAITYDEIRVWARWLDTFTASDLADAMGVDLSQGQKGITALLWHGICEDTGEALDGPDGQAEPVIQYIPPPPGPNEHHTETPPERNTPGCYELAPVRGMPIRIRSERDMRKVLTTSGAAAVHRRREAAYQKQEEARRRAMEQAEIKRRREAEAGGPKWKQDKLKRVKRMGAAIERGRRKAQERNAVRESMDD